MKVVLEVWQAISLLIMAASLFVGLGKWTLSQFQRSLESRLMEIAKDARAAQAVERDLLQLKVELAKEYVRREDYIRGQTVLEAKLDRLFSELEVVKIQGGKA